MKFGVIQCANCKTARGVMLDARSTTCPRCGRKMDVKNARILSTAATEKELARKVMRFNVAISEGEEIYTSDLQGVDEPQEPGTEKGNMEDVFDDIAGKLIDTKGKDDRIRAAAEELDRHLGEFSEDDFCEVLVRMGFKDDDDWGKYLAKLKASNVIFEPRSGVFRCIEKAV